MDDSDKDQDVSGLLCLWRRVENCEKIMMLGDCCACREDNIVYFVYMRPYLRRTTNSDEVNFLCYAIDRITY